MPNSLGNNNDNSISTRYRGLNPSYLGKLDINVCGKYVATDSLIAGNSYKDNQQPRLLYKE